MNKAYVFVIMILATINSLYASDIPLKDTTNNRLNMVQFSIGYAEAFVNGFAIDNPVHKTGITLEGSYYRNLTGIIHLGVIGGYSHTIDRSNPDYLIKDEETIHYLHIGILLQLIDTKKHNLHFGIGSGYTHTNRVLGTSGFDGVPLQGPTSYSNFASRGYSGRMLYSYSLSSSFSIGIHYSLVDHNDGSWSTGINLNYHF